MSRLGLPACCAGSLLPVLTRVPASSRLAWAVVRDPRVGRRLWRLGRRLVG